MSGLDDGKKKEIIDPECPKKDCFNRGTVHCKYCTENKRADNPTRNHFIREGDLEDVHG